MSPRENVWQVYFYMCWLSWSQLVTNEMRSASTCSPLSVKPQTLTDVFNSAHPQDLWLMVLLIIKRTILSPWHSVALVIVYITDVITRVRWAHSAPCYICPAAVLTLPEGGNMEEACCTQSVPTYGLSKCILVSCGWGAGGQGQAVA